MGHPVTLFGLADIVIVVEAAQRSGAMITVDQALEQNREVMAVPGRADDICSQGCNELIKTGAMVITKPEDIWQCSAAALWKNKNNKINKHTNTDIKALNGGNGNKKPVCPTVNLLATEKKLVYSVLCLHPKDTDEIINETGLNVSTVMQTLLLLQLEGCVEAAMRAGNFDDNKYKFFKIVYNMFGLLFGMGLVRYLVFQAIGSDEADWFMVVFYGCAAAIFLYIGMVGMDRSNKRRYYNTYSRMVGITFTYEIDADGIIVTDEEDDSDSFRWDDVIKWNEDKDNIYLFVAAHNCLVINKDSFTEGTQKDLKELVTAVMALRDDADTEQEDKNED